MFVGGGIAVHDGDRLSDHHAEDVGAIFAAALRKGDGLLRTSKARLPSPSFT